MPVQIAHGFIDNLYSSSTHTLSVGFQPKAGVFWAVIVSSSTNAYQNENIASIGFWSYIGSSHVHQCHAAYRSGSSASYVAAYTDCIAAIIDFSSRFNYVYVTGVSSNGITINIYSTSGGSGTKYRLHWVLFGGDVTVSCGRILVPSGSSWSPISVTGGGFDVLFSSYASTQSTTPTNKHPVALCITHHDKAAGVYRYTTNGISNEVYRTFQEVGEGTSARIYLSESSSNYITIYNTNNNNDLTIARNTGVSTNASTFLYLSLRGIPAWSDRFILSNSTASEESKSYTVTKPPSLLMLFASAWANNSNYTRVLPHSTPAIFYSISSGSQAFAITKTSVYIYDYSSSDKSYIADVTSSYDINQSYWRFVSYNSNTLNYAAKAPGYPLSTPVFVLGLGDSAFLLRVSSNSQKILARIANRRRTYTASSNWNALLFTVTPFKQILSVASNGLAALVKKLSYSLSTSSGQTSTLRLRRFLALITSNSYITSLKLLTKKLLTVTSDYWVFIRLPLNIGQTLIAVSDSLASLFKKLFVPLNVESEHESLIEKTILLVLRAFSSWLAWIELMVFKVLEVITDTRNDVEREVTYLFRTYEQELSAISSSVSEVAKTFFRELLAGVFQWARLERIRGPVFALRSWLWRVSRRKHGCQ